MADKQVPLSIVIRTVDRATAGINAINKRLDAMTKPLRDFGKALSDLGEKSGFDSVVAGFRGVGNAIGGVLSKVAVIGGVVALAVHGVLGLVEEFDNLGDTSEKLGVTVDFLAAMRFAAERSGASVESLDQGMSAFGASMGQLRAGGGRMLKFLMSISPALVTQLKATKGNEAAFRLLADAMEKITDPQKRLALAQKTVGDTALVPMLARGSKGLLELQGEFAGLAGSQEDAAEAAGKADDALKDLKASSMGVKAALVTGLAPALTVVIQKMTAWLVEHREDVKQWAIDLGTRIPAAFDKLVIAVKGAVKWVDEFVDGIGGWKVAAVGMAAVITGPLISAITNLGIAMLATPFGVFLAGAAAIALLAADIAGAGKPRSSKSFDAQDRAMGSGALPGGNERAPTALEAKLMASGALPKSRRFLIAEGRSNALARDVTTFRDAARAADIERPLPELGPVARLPAGSVFSPGQAPSAKLTVDFVNTPRTTRVTADPKNTADVDHTVGYQMAFAP